MKTTARFELERSSQLRRLFTRRRLVDLWRNLVKNQMRKFDITDLHDYYDFNFAIEARADVIVERVLAGQYRADAPLVYRLEKKCGICRHMLVPTPSDSLVFQLLTDTLYPAIIRARPSKQAFYSRERHQITLPHEHPEAASYPWFILWPKFQQQIWKFTKAHKYLVTTDLTNYFDNIGLRELRHVISSIGKTKEVYLDLLFSLIEDLSWTPDYLPTSHKGLPIINIEAPRLLAYALLFEVDYLLKRRTKNNFVRWMDDINFGVADRRTANTLLGEINDVLKSRGLALNLAKTEVLRSSEAEAAFMFRENKRIDKLQARIKRVKQPTARRLIAIRAKKEFGQHLKTCKARNRDKVTKRYLTALGMLRAPIALKQAVAVYTDQPALRSSVLRYLSSLPFSTPVANVFTELLRKTEVYDDFAKFGCVSAVVDWQIPRRRTSILFVKEFGKQLGNPKSPFEWLCRLVFASKYSEPDEVLSITKNYRRVGAKEPFFARQRIAALSRCLGIDRKAVLSQWRTEVSTGSSDSASVAMNLLQFSKPALPPDYKRARLYLFPTNKQSPYPLAKFLLLCVLAGRASYIADTNAYPAVAIHVTCPWYRHWLGGINPHWI